jgi:hypothetical protein
MATAKHFSMHYLLPGFCLFSTIFPLLYLNFKDKYKISKTLTAAFIFLFSASNLFYTMPYYHKLLNFTQDIHDLNGQIMEKYPACTIIPATSEDADFFINEQEALQRANGFTFRMESEDLSRIYPKSYYFFSEEVTSPDPRVESYGIWDYKQRVFADDIIPTCPCAIFIKYATGDLSSYPFQVHLIDHSKYLNAFLLVNSTEKLANFLFEQAMDSFKQGNYRQALMLGFKSRQLNYEPKGQLEYFLSVTYRNLLRSN